VEILPGNATALSGDVDLREVRAGAEIFEQWLRQ
jgi:hypothetical protein